MLAATACSDDDNDAGDLRLISRSRRKIEEIRRRRTGKEGGPRWNGASPRDSGQRGLDKKGFFGPMRNSIPIASIEHRMPLFAIPIEFRVAETRRVAPLKSRFNLPRRVDFYPAEYRLETLSARLSLFGTRSKFLCRCDYKDIQNRRCFDFSWYKKYVVCLIRKWEYFWWNI